MTATDKPKVSFNLDKFEREGVAREPFVVAAEGKTIRFLDAQDCDYRDLTAGQEAAATGNLEPLLEMIVHPQDAEKLKAVRLPVWKLNGLLKAWQEHFGMTGLGEAGASSGS